MGSDSECRVLQVEGSRGHTSISIRRAMRANKGLKPKINSTGMCPCSHHSIRMAPSNLPHRLAKPRPGMASKAESEVQGLSP